MILILVLLQHLSISQSLNTINFSDEHVFTTHFAYSSKLGPLIMDMNVFLNQNYEFNIFKENIESEIIGNRTIITDPKHDQLHDHYSYSELLGLAIHYPSKSFTTQAYLKLIEEKESFTKELIYPIDLAYVFIDQEQQEFDRKFLNLDLIYTYHFNPLSIGFNINNLTFVKSRERHYLKSPLTEYLLTIKRTFENNNIQFKLNHHSIYSTLQNENFDIQIGFDYTYRFSVFGASYQYNLTNDIHLRSAFHFTMLKNNDSEFLFKNRNYLLEKHAYNKQSVRLTLTYDLDSNPFEDLEIKQILYSDKIYLSDDEHRPFVRIKVFNHGRNRHQLSFTLRHDSMRFESNSKHINPGDMEEYIIYMNRDSIHMSKLKEKIYFEIFQHLNDKEQKAADGEVIVFDPHIWNGDITNLTQYVDIDAFREIDNQRLDSIVLSSENDHAFKSLITELGRLIHYQKDPLFSYDYIQFPKEIIASGKGDCEDLIVFYYSYLSYLGIQSKIIPIKMQENAQSHLFLLIDTGIASSQYEDMIYHEYNSMIFTNRDGRQTIWIPIETTKMQYGFDEAFRLGVKHFQYLKKATQPIQYYELEHK